MKVERPELLKVIAWAAGLGDRSENADYIYGKKRLREIDKRLRFLGKRIDIAYVVEPEKIQSDKVQFGATVIVEDEKGEEKEYSIVGVDEIDVSVGRISFKSPIGSTLLGKSVGDIAEVKTPKGTVELKINNIKYQKLDWK